MKLKKLLLYSLLSLNTLGLVACNKPVNQQQLATSEAELLYAQGERYYLGEDIPQDYQKAFKLFEQAANKGLAVAQNDLGGMYFEGTGIKKDNEKAFVWIKKSADQNYPGAEYNLGIMYDHGYYVLKNRAEALVFYKKSADQGYAKAQFNLGNAYATGDGVTKNEQKALELYTKAAEQDLPEAQYNLANLYEYILNDKVKAKYWYELASKNGIEQAKDALERLKS